MGKGDDRDEWAVRIGARIADLRKHHKDGYISLGGLARRAGAKLSKSQIGNYEQAIRRPGIEEALALGSALGVPACTILCIDHDVMALEPEERELMEQYLALKPGQQETVRRVVQELHGRSADPLHDTQHNPLYSIRAADKMSDDFIANAGAEKDNVQDVSEKVGVQGAVLGAAHGSRYRKGAAASAADARRAKGRAAANRGPKKMV